jgi:lipid II:glycine glycyltransferase (peptidoglycan interpeptide bridge formation enzyme)
MPITVCRWEDPPSWNDFVASVPLAHFQQSWEWGELAPDLGGQAIRLAAEQDGLLVGAMQLFVNNLSRTGRSLLYVPRGPALLRPSVEVLGPLLDAARRMAREAGAIGIRLEPNVPRCDAAWKSTLTALGLQPMAPPAQPRSSWVLDISADEEAVLAAMKSKTRYNIRLAGRKGMEVSEAGPDDLPEFYALFRETAERDDFFIHTEDVYRRMFSLFWGAGRFAMLFARFGGRLIAAITLLRFGGTCWYLQGASSNADRNLMPTYLLQWEGIRWARSHGCTEYDFRAVPDVLREDQDMFGVYRFKEGFGGRQFTTLPTYGAAYNPPLFAVWRSYYTGRFLLDQWQRKRKGLPLRQFA